MIVAILSILTLGPLLLLGAFLLADRLGLKAADRILDWTMAALIGQWRIGCLVNALGGAALAAGGVYLALVAGPILHRIVALVMIPGGLWRLWRGVAAWPDRGSPRP